MWALCSRVERNKVQCTALHIQISLGQNSIITPMREVDVSEHTFRLIHLFMIHLHSEMDVDRKSGCFHYTTVRGLSAIATLSFFAGDFVGVL